MLSIGTKWTYIARTVVHQAMPNHLILPLKAFATFTARALFNRTVVWPGLTVYILVRTRVALEMKANFRVGQCKPKEVLCLERCGKAARVIALVARCNHHGALRHSRWRR